MSLSAEQWGRIKAVFDAAVALDPTERVAFLERECGGDATLRKQLEDLLDAHEREPDFLETPAAVLFDRSPPADDLIGRTIGTYRLLERLGAGGMGVVYKAEDSKLDRPVALKLMAQSVATDSDRLRRFHAEARAASSLNHPQILVIHDFGEIDGRPFIVTEFVEGQTLRQRMTASVVPVGEAVAIAIQVAGALAAAHARGLMHRDIKPENVMLRPDGYVKVLDFGLAKLMTPAAIESVTETHPGTVMGTPRYMSPEQARGLEVDARTDIWSLGVMLYEMLAGRPPFDGPTPSDVMAAVLRSDPLLSDSGLAHVPAIVSAVVEQALAKEAGLRYASAADMHKALTAARASLESGAVPAIASPVTAGPRTRLIVLPFRVMRPDADTGFLAFSLPDAITTSLAGLHSLLVRPSITAARFASEEPDLEEIASEADVDVVLSGTLLRAGDEIRVTTQLVDATAGNVILSSTLHAPVGDLFRLQDELTIRIVESLALPLTTRERRQLRHDVPASARAYDFYLRANQAGLEATGWAVARDLYLQAVEEDPKFAPAWARLARVYRLLGKYGVDQAGSYLEKAEAALRRALALNPDLPMAHNLYAQLDADRGRAEDAVVRLLTRAKTHGADPEIYAGLVHACRYCGLLEASLAAHHLAVGLDVNQATSVMQTNFVMGRYEDVLRDPRLVKGYVSMLSLVTLGRNDEAIATMAQIDQARFGRRGTDLILSVKALAEGDRSSSCEHLSKADLPDAEGLFYVARQFAYLGEARRALDVLARSIGAGYFAYPTLADSWFDPIRNEPEFQRLRERAREGHESALKAFRAAGGPMILGPSEATAPELPTPVTSRPSVRTRVAWALVAATIVAVIGVVTFRAIDTRRAAPAASTPAAPAAQPNAQNRLVVLPFENLSRNPADDWLAGGFSDTLTYGLQKLRTFTLVSRDRVAEAYRSQAMSDSAPLDPAMIGRISQSLGVQYYVHGTYQRVGNQLRVVARLAAVSSGEIKAQESVTDSIDNVLQLEDDLASRFAIALEGSPSRVERSRTRSVEAYQAYTEGRTQWEAGKFAAALPALRRAVTLDATYEQAWALLSKAHSRLVAPSQQTTDEVAEREHRREALRAAERAVTIAPEYDDAHTALALAHRANEQVGPWRTEAQRAIELNPRSYEAHVLLGDSFTDAPLYTCRRTPDSALAEAYFRTAIRLDPADLRAYEQLVAYLVMTDSPATPATVTQVLASHPKAVISALAQSQLMLEAKRVDEAAAVLRPLNHQVIYVQLMEGWVTLARGERAAARQLFEQAVEKGVAPWPLLSATQMAFRGGDVEAAHGFLSRAIARDPACRAFVVASNAFVRERAHPSIAALLRQGNF